MNNTMFIIPLRETRLRDDLERQTLIAGGGSERLLLRITPAEVVRVTGAVVADVCAANLLEMRG